MAKCRSIVGFALLVFWTAIPALACLPSQGMTQAEMACCKKMLGNCQMGAGHHPCCKTSVNRAAPALKVEQDTSPIQPHAVAVLLDSAPLPATILDREFTTQLGLPPPAPPDLNSVLRI